MRRWCAAFIVLFLFSCILHAQNPNVTITGTIQGPNGLPASNTIISFTPSQSFFVPGSGGTTVCNSYVVQINGTGLTCGDTINFNSTTPAAPVNGLNVAFAKSTSGPIDSVSAAVVGDGNPSHCLVGTGIFTACVGASLPSAPGANYSLFSLPTTFATAWAPYVTCDPATGLFLTWDLTGSQPGNANSPNPGWYCGSGNGAYIGRSPTVASPNLISPVGTTTDGLDFSMPVGSTGNFQSGTCPGGSSPCWWIDSNGAFHTTNLAPSQFPCLTAPTGSSPTGTILTGCDSATNQLFVLNANGILFEVPTSGVSVFTGSHAASINDGALTIMNCSSACTYTLPNPQPFTKWSTRLMSIGSSVATVVRGSSITWNNGTSVPVLNSWEAIPIWADSTTATNYYGNTPLAAGTGVSITSTATAQTIAASGTVSLAYSTQSATGAASLGATTMVTPGANTPYTITFYVFQVGAGSGCTGNTSITPAIVYQDPNEAAAHSTTLAAWVIATNGTANLRAAEQSGTTSYSFQAASGTAIQYATTYALGSGCSTSPTYFVIPYLVQL